MITVIYLNMLRHVSESSLVFSFSNINLKDINLEQAGLFTGHIPQVTGPTIKANSTVES